MDIIKDQVTTRVVRPGDPIKTSRRTPDLGPELLPIPTPDSYWSKSATADVADGLHSITDAAAAGEGTFRVGLAKAGKEYRVQFQLLSVSGPGVRVQAGTTFGGAKTVPGDYIQIVNVTVEGDLGIYSAGLGVSAEWTVRSIREVLP